VKPEAVARAERILDEEVVSWQRVARRGYSVNEHWVLEPAHGERVFVKVGHVAPSPDWVRSERRVLELVSGAFMPDLIGFEDGDSPLLVLEYLTDGWWPPPWRENDVAAVQAALDEIAAAEVKGELPRLADAEWPGWSDIAADPEPFLHLGIVSREWLDEALPALIEASAAAPLAGESLLHCDVRSDNLCIRRGRAILVDWNHARVGNPAFDLAFWLPSLRLEGGPPPDSFGVDELACFVAGFFAAWAGRPKPGGAPTVREFQRAQLEVALPWACKALDLPLP
jgi:phosphotransferase family enzyme